MNNNDSHSINTNDIDNNDHNDDSHKLEAWNTYYTYVNEHYNDNHNECDLLSFIP